MGPVLAIPNPKFGHPILVALGIAALHSILTVSKLNMSETWMEKMKMMHPLGFLLILTQISMKIMTMILPGLQYTLIMAQGTHTMRDSRQRTSRVFLSWDTIRGISMHRIYPGLWHGFKGTRRGFVGISFSILNGGIFPIDDIPVNFRNILEQERKIERYL